MTEIWTLAALWLGLALLATLLSIWLRIATALSEIVVGTIAQLVIGAIIGAAVLGTDQTWVKFLSGTGAILLTFLAGAELDPVVFRERWKEAGAVGVISPAPATPGPPEPIPQRRCRLGCRDGGHHIKRAEFHGEWNYTISPNIHPPNHTLIS